MAALHAVFASLLMHLLLKGNKGKAQWKLSMSGA
jgi:hypothetical protein